MDLLQAIKERHSVRKYIDRPIEAEKVAAIKQFIDECNRESGLHLQLVTEEPLAFSTGLFSYGKFTGVKNYIALVAPKQGDYREAIGYQGEKIVLFMQTLGLSTCWVGLTFKNIKDAYVLNPGEELKFVIACGYGEDGGVQHPQKKPITHYYSDKRGTGEPLPDWFMRGMEAALLAPTAVNQQKFLFTLLPNGRVEAKAKFDFIGYSHYDLGIVKYHFEVAAGKENFTWA
jgi:nitroreductase